MINFEHQCLSFPTCMASPMAGWTHGPTHPWHRLGDVCPTVDSWISKPLYGGVLLAGHSVEWTLPAAPTCCTILGFPLVATSHGLVPLALWDLPPLVGSLVLCWHWNLAWLAWKGLVAHWEAWLWRRLHLAWLDWEVDLGAWAKDWGGDLVEWLALQVSLVAWLAWTWWHDLAHLPRWQHCWWPHCLDWSRRWWLHWLAWMAFWCQTTQAGRLCQWICCLSVQCWWCFNTKNIRSNLLGIHVDRELWLLQKMSYITNAYLQCLLAWDCLATAGGCCWATDGLASQLQQKKQKKTDKAYKHLPAWWYPALLALHYGGRLGSGPGHNCD